MLIWLLHNQRAGHPGWAQTMPRLAELLSRDGYDVRLKQGRDAAALRAEARLAVTAGARVVLAAGGDGTIGAVAAALRGTTTALGVLPTGTANVWARQLDLALPVPGRLGQLHVLARGLLAVPPRSIDLATCAGVPFVTWAGLGLDAHILRRLGHRSALARRLGWPYLAAASLLHGVSSRPVEMSLECQDGQSLRGRFVLVVATCIPRFAGGFVTLSPHTRLDDGLLDVWAFTGDGPLDQVRHAWHVLTGRHRQAPGVYHLAAAQVRLTTNGQAALHADGETIPVEEGDLTQDPATRRTFELCLQVGALRVLLPALSADRLLTAKRPSALPHRPA